MHWKKWFIYCWFVLHFFDQNVSTVKLSGDDNLTAMRVLLCRIYVALNFRVVGFALKLCCLLYRSSELSQNTKWLPIFQFQVALFEWNIMCRHFEVESYVVKRKRKIFLRSHRFQFSPKISLFRNKGFLVNLKTQRNASKFAMFMEKENPRSFFRFSFRAFLSFPLWMPGSMLTCWSISLDKKVDLKPLFSEECTYK